MTEILGIGTDIIEISRIESTLTRHGGRFLEKILTEREREYCAKYAHPLPHIAGRFAAKEAIVKALGSGFTDEAAWQEVEVINNDEGKPEVLLSSLLQQELGNRYFLISISHCKQYATATALLMTKD